MGRMIGVDAGTTAIKIAIDQGDGAEPHLLRMRVPEGAGLEECLHRCLAQAGLTVEGAERIVLTGMRSLTFSAETLAGIPVQKVLEFEAIARGGLLLSGETSAMVASIGTGSAFVHAGPDGNRHMGGSGVGGGTFQGLMKRLGRSYPARELEALLEQGDLRQVDLTMGDISPEELPGLPAYVTAANFGKVLPTARDADLILGLTNMVFQTVGLLAAFACQATGDTTVVAVGTLSTLKQGQRVLEAVGGLHGLRFVVPPRAAFATVLGALESAKKIG